MATILSYYQIIQYILLGTALLVHSKNQKSSRILGIAFFASAIDLLATHLVENSLLPTHLIFAFLVVIMTAYFLGLFLTSTYFLNLINQKPRFYLFIPHVAAGYITIYTLIHILDAYNTLLIGLTESIYTLYYFVLVIYIYRKIHHFIFESAELSSHQLTKLQYIKIYLLVNLFSYTIVGIINIVAIAYDFDPFTNDLRDNIVNFLFIPCQALLVLSISYVLLTKPEIWNAALEEEKLNFKQKIIKTLAYAPKTNKVLMTDEKYQSLVNSIRNQIESMQVYLNPDISLVTMAESTGHKLHDVSYVINRHFGKNFNALMNDFRIEHAKKLLSRENDNSTMFQIALDSGFNTESVFYTTFRKLTGFSPAEYKKKIRSSQL